MDITFKQTDLSDQTNQSVILRLLNDFSLESSHPQTLSPETHGTLLANLRQHPTSIVYFAENGLVPIGIAVCFLGFSTFANQPLLNIHDLYIEKEFQGLGIGRRFLEYIECQAKGRGCCKVTLEVYHSNERAAALYASRGYTGGSNETRYNILYFLSKKI